MESIKIIIGKDYSFTPGPRYEKEGAHSGEIFRKEILAPLFKQAISKKIKIVVNLDGTEGYGTSFLEESFGGLIRVEKIDYEIINKYLVLISNEEEYLLEDIEKYLIDAKNESEKKDN